MTSFDNKNILVTGGTTGIGFETTKQLVSQGANVAFTGADKDRIDTASRELGEAAFGIQCDQSELDAIDAMAQSLADRGGSIDGVVLNAGVTMAAPTEMETPEQFAQQLMINLRGPYFIVQKLLPILNNDASIVAVTSCLHQLGMPGMGVYSASKAGLRSLVRTWAAEFKSKGIRVNSVAPGPINTPIYGKLGLPEADLQAMAQDIQSRVPMNRFGGPDEVAQAISFLLSDASSYMTGSEIMVDGGWTDL